MASSLEPNGPQKVEKLKLITTDDDEDSDTTLSESSMLNLMAHFEEGFSTGDCEDFDGDNKTPNFDTMRPRILEKAGLNLDDRSTVSLPNKDYQAVPSQALSTAPLFCPDVNLFSSTYEAQDESFVDPLTQFGLIGRNLTAETQYHGSDEGEHFYKDEWGPLVLANMNIPWSAFICGSQGAGKSHTLSCILENGLLKSSRIGVLPNPLAAMVFHYDSYTRGLSSQVCEAAYLSSVGIPVTVLVAPSNIWAMTKLYTNLPGLPRDAPRPKVAPLYLSDSALDVTTILKLMAVDTSSNDVPLYMEIVMTILREMAMEGKGSGAFSYPEFRSRLDEVEWIGSQRVPLDLRLQLLDSCLEPSQFTKTTRPARSSEDIWTFPPGSLTIVDLSDPFIDSNDACSLFAICLSLFLEDRAQCGRIVALDEAHKFLTQSGAARALTNDLTSVIRQQRHIGTRVVIATQEPTLAPELIDLCNATFVHRFLSPAWYEVLKKHLAGANKHDSGQSKTVSLFEQIIALETGQALLFCPTAMLPISPLSGSDTAIQPLGSGYLTIRIRKRMTYDGGQSILASENKQQLSSSPPEQDIPMHVVSKIPASRSAKRNAKARPKAADLGTTMAATKVADINVQRARPDRISFFPHTVDGSLDAFPPKPTKPATDAVAAVARKQMRKLFKELRWHNTTDVVLPRLIVETEIAMDQRGLFKDDKEYRNVIRKAGLDEHRKCREKYVGP